MESSSLRTLKADGKELERSFLEQLRDLVGDFPRGPLIPGETPDFRIDLGAEILGIEVTRLMDESERRDESEWDSIVREAGALARTCLPAVDVAVGFRSGARVDKRNRKVIAAALVQAVSERLPVPSEHLTIFNDWRGSLPECVHCIDIHRSERLSGHVWSVLDGGMGRTECHSEIQSRISHKEKKLPKCLEACSRCWLLVVTPKDEPSSFFEPDGLTRTTVYSSAYERVFFLDAFSNRFFELLLRPG